MQSGQNPRSSLIALVLVIRSAASDFAFIIQLCEAQKSSTLFALGIRYRC